MTFELLFNAADQKLMSADIVAGPDFHASGPRSLFPFPRDTHGGDVSPELVTNEKATPPQTRPNPQSNRCPIRRR